MEFILEIIYMIKQRMGHVINLDEYSDTGTHWVAFYASNNNVTCYDSFGVEYISKEI